MSDEQKLLAACVDYRAKLDKLEAENAALKKEKAQLWDNVVFWHEAYCSVGEALGINEPERSGYESFAELVKELVAKNAALRVALEDIMMESDEQHIWRMARAALERKEAQP